MKFLARLTPVAVVALSCISCAHRWDDFGLQTDAILTSEFMKEQFGTTIPDLASGAQCPGTQDVSVDVVEQRKGKRTVFLFAGGTRGITVSYEGFAASVQRYFMDALREAKVRVVPTGGKLLQIRIEEVEVYTGWGPTFGTTTLAIAAPDWSHSATYTGKETSGRVERAIAYSVHVS